MEIKFNFNKNKFLIDLNQFLNLIWIKITNNKKKILKNTYLVFKKCPV